MYPRLLPRRSGSHASGNSSWALALTREKLFPSKAQLICAEASKIPKRPWDQFHSFKLDVQDGQYHLISNPDGEADRDLGIIDVVTQGTLDTLTPIEGLKFEAVIASSALGPKTRKKTDIVDASVNIMGPEILADAVGTALDSAEVNLQHPLTLPTGMRYINPQWWYATDERTDLRHLVGPRLGDSNSRRISELIEAALGSLDQPKAPHSFDESSGLTSVSEFLRTRLKPYDYLVGVIQNFSSVSDPLAGTKWMACISFSAGKMRPAGESFLQT